MGMKAEHMWVQCMETSWGCMYFIMVGPTICWSMFDCLSDWILVGAMSTRRVLVLGHLHPHDDP